MKKPEKHVISVHTHFNIYRNVHDAHEGDVTLTEQLKAAQRFVRWHERQVIVGKALIHKINCAIDAATPLYVVEPAHTPPPPFEEPAILGAGGIAAEPVPSECVCRTPTCGHVASLHGTDGLCSVCNVECWL